MTKTLTALIAAATLAKCDIRRVNDGGCALRRLRGRRRRTAGRCSARLRVLSGLWGTAARAQLQLVPHADLLRLRKHGRLARASRGGLLLVSRLSSVATALIAHQPLRFGLASWARISRTAISITCARIMPMSTSARSTSPIPCNACRKRSARTIADSCNATNDAYATGLIRQRTTASLGGQGMLMRQQRGRGLG